jgi:uncharacterized iron-regulated protein
MQAIGNALNNLWDAWVEARIAYAKQYVIRNGNLE